MKSRVLLLCFSLAGMLASQAFAQRMICIDGQCHMVQPSRVIPYSPPVVASPSNTIFLNPLEEELELENNSLQAVARVGGADRFDQVIRATVRVTVSNVCGSGTVVGRDRQGNAIVLTNAHVAGTNRGRTVNLERWEPDGSSERGTGTIIASGYGRGMSVDFALLRCNSEFARDVDPVPLADRYPDASGSVTTYGCPRCEWPSLQVLKMNRAEGQLLTWKPEAIGGRSGSSVIDHTSAGPRVVGLLTWGGGGEGLGQSTPFLLNAMRGQLPASIESLPSGVREVSCQDEQLAFYQVPATTAGEALSLPVEEAAARQVDNDLIDSITEDQKDPNENGLRDRNKNPGTSEGPIRRGFQWLRRVLITLVLCGGSAIGGFFVGRYWK